MKYPFLFVLALAALLLPGCSKFEPEPKASDWKTYASEEYGISVDSPYPIEFKEATVKAKAGYQVLSAQGKVEKLNVRPAQFILDILGQKFTGEVRIRIFFLEVNSFLLPERMVWDTGKFLDSQEALVRQGFPDDKWEDFKFERSKVKCCGLPALQLEGTFRMKSLLPQKAGMRYSVLGASRGRRLWSLSLICGDLEEYRRTKEKLFKSFKIGPPAP